MKKSVFSRLAILTFALLLLCSLVACGEDETDGEGEKGGNIYSLNYKGTVIALGADATPVLNKLGEAKSVEEIGDCAGFGAQVKYVYDDLTLNVLKGTNSVTVDSIVLTNDLVSTDQGVCIGDAKSKVIEAYGTPTYENAKRLEYNKDTHYLTFMLDESGTITSIEWAVVNQ